MNTLRVLRPKFIQITMSQSQILALDEAGTVWEYRQYADSRQNHWISLNTERRP